MEVISQLYIFGVTKSNQTVMLLQNKTEFINMLHSILTAPNTADIEVIMMALDGVRLGHGVLYKCWSRFITDIAQADEFDAYLIEKREWTAQNGKGRVAEYFADAISSVKASEDIDCFADLCEQVMDFSVLTAGNRVNMAKAEGPY